MWEVSTLKIEKKMKPFSVKIVEISVLAISLASLAGQFQTTMFFFVFVNVYLSQVKFSMGCLTLSAYASNLCVFCIRNHYIAHFIFHAYIK